jgi:hypothetical protein
MVDRHATTELHHQPRNPPNSTFFFFGVEGVVIGFDLMALQLLGRRTTT